MKYFKGFFKLFFKIWNLKVSFILGGFSPLINFLNHSTKSGDINSFRFYNAMNDTGVYSSIDSFYTNFFQFFMGFFGFGELLAFLLTIILVGSLIFIGISFIFWMRCVFSGDFEKELNFILSKIK